MTAGQMIKILQAVEPETSVCFTIGERYTNGGAEYRKDCAKVQLEGYNCLGFLEARRADIFHGQSDDPLQIDFILEQFNYSDKEIDDIVKEYDRHNKTN